MSQTPIPTPPSIGSTMDDEFWKKQAEALLGARSLRDLERELRRYQPYVGTGLSDEDIARRDLDVAIHAAVEAVKGGEEEWEERDPYWNSRYVPDYVRRVSSLDSDYAALTGKDRSDAAIARKSEIIQNSRAAHENDEARMQLATEALATKREMLVAQAYDDVWMGALDPDLSISNYEVAQVQDFRNRWDVVEINDPLGPGDIADPQMLAEYAELRGLLNRGPGRDFGAVLAR